jgi:hypothetical protein
MTDPRDMTTGEAAAWRAGWRAAIEKALAMCEMTARLPDESDRHPTTLTYRLGANNCWQHVSAVREPPA